MHRAEGASGNHEEQDGRLFFFRVLYAVVNYLIVANCIRRAAARAYRIQELDLSPGIPV